MEKNKKVIRLTEQDLERLVRRIINESEYYESSDVNQMINSFQEKIGSLRSESVEGDMTYYFNPSNELVVIEKSPAELIVSGKYFFTEFGWEPTIWSISRSDEKYFLKYFKEVWEQQISRVNTIRVGDSMVYRDNKPRGNEFIR